MTTSESKLSQTLAAQSVSSAEQVQSLFAELRARFDLELAAATSPTIFKSFRDTWLARKSGVITLVTDHWLRPATPELKRAVGAALNELRKHVDSEIAGRQASLSLARELNQASGIASIFHFPESFVPWARTT